MKKIKSNTCTYGGCSSFYTARHHHKCANNFSGCIYPPFSKYTYSRTKLVDLKKRIARQPNEPRTRECKAETRGVQLATMQALAKYWACKHDWRKVEAKLNALPQFVTNIDGVDIHFIHVRSKHKNALARHHYAWLARIYY